VTSSGNASLFNGVPDWIYEEEVLSDNNALWWSPDSSKVAFLRLDETEVDEFRFPIYNPTGDSYAVIPYTEDVVIKYPKPGYNNPLASLHVFDVAQYLERSETYPDADIYTYELTWEGRFPVTNSIIMDVSWVGQSTLIVKEVTRAADNGNVVYFNLSSMWSAETAPGRVVRRLGSSGEEGDEGWIQSVRGILMLCGHFFLKPHCRAKLFSLS
jgi:dipeptidyl aminopeptidase B